MPNHILTARQFADDRELVEGIFDEAQDYKEKETKRKRLTGPKISNIRESLANQVIATAFYEPSTRTRLSFESAASKLGAKIISTENARETSSVSKGETIEDTARIIAGYADMIIMRHDEENAAARAAAVSPVPIINAGDGVGEHPTQAVLDLFTIHNELKTIDNLKIALVGDLLKGRTIHSLTQMFEISKNPEIFLVAPELLRLPAKYRDMMKAKGMKFHETPNLHDVLGHVDVVYMTRLQKERFKGQEELYERVKNSYIIGPKEMAGMQEHAILMHPLPRVGEISPEVDRDPRSAYFRQAENGLYVRMALLNHVSEGKIDPQTRNGRISIPPLSIPPRQA